MSDRLRGFGLSCSVLPGWDIRIAERAESPVPVPGSTEPMGGYTYPILHAGTSPLPSRRGDYGSGYVELMSRSDVFLCLGEFDPYDGIADMFDAGMTPPLRLSDFHPDAQQRVIPGMCGAQRFFTTRRRAFGLYVVLGSWLQRGPLIDRANELLSTIEIDRR